MDIRTLHQFLCLADSLHFGRASEICHISASTLSRNIKQLEKEVAAELFVRDNRSVSLTREGELFQRYARDAISQWDGLRNTLMEESQELQGELSVYCSVTASYSFLYDILSDFRRQHSRVELKLHTGDPALAVPRVLAGEEDVAIAARPDHLPSGVAFKPIADSSLLFIAPADHQALPTLQGELAQVMWSQVPMILSEAGLARERVDDWFRQRNLKPQIYAQVAGNEAIVSMVALGLGVGIVPQIVLDNSPLASQVRILPVTPALQPFQVGLCTLKKKLKSPLVRAFWEQI